MTQTTTTVSAGISARIQILMDRESNTTLRCRRPLLFPLTCQHRRNISQRVEVYGSRKRHGSMTQTTTTVSTGMPARMQKSMDQGSDVAPRCRRPLPFPLTCQHRRNISRRVEVYGSRKQRGSMTQTTTTVSAGMPARMQKSMDRGSDAAPRCCHGTLQGRGRLRVTDSKRLLTVLLRSHEIVGFISILVRGTKCFVLICLDGELRRSCLHRQPACLQPCARLVILGNYNSKLQYIQKHEKSQTEHSQSHTGDVAEDPTLGTYSDWGF